MTDKQKADKTKEFYTYLKTRFTPEQIQLLTGEQMGEAVKEFYKAGLAMLQSIENSITTKGNIKRNLGLS